MSEPIIIETPTTTRERLVLVPPSCVTEEYESQAGPRLGITGGVARDATPADLKRGGFAPLSAFVGPLDLLSPPTLAGALEAIGGIQKDADRWEGELATVKRDYADIQRQLGEERERAETAEAARDALRDQITAAGCEAAHAGERTYECDVARPCGLCRLRTRAEKAERERDEALLRAHTGVVHYEILRQSGEEAARQRDEARAELARLTAPGEGSEGEPTDNDLRDVWGPESTMANARRAIYRLGVAHERARHVEKDRATDEELGRVFGEAYTVEESPDHGVALRTAYLALAARVRQERCLVTQAVAMRAGVTISRTSERVPGTTGMWNVYVTRRPDVPGEHYAYGVAASDVPATLARLLGEVGRG